MGGKKQYRASGKAERPRTALAIRLQQSRTDLEPLVREDKPAHPIKYRCRHNRYWLMCGGYLSWCYECGAVRRMQRVEGANAVTALDTGWTKPVGKGGMNPALKGGYDER